MRYQANAEAYNQRLVTVAARKSTGISTGCIYIQYGNIYHMADATRIFYDKFVYADGAIREMSIWQLPESSTERPHRLKYSLFYGFPGSRLVGYDNEKGKGDHRHYENVEKAYFFISAEQLIEDFKSDIERLRGKST